MDYYNFNHNSADSLQFLYGPPFSRKNIEHSNKKCIRPFCSPFNNVFIRDGPCSPYQVPETSSTSLVLEKTTSRQVTEQYFNNSNQYPCLLNSIIPKKLRASNNRPVIKVTVIPNATSSHPRKRRSKVKRVQSSVSNREIKTKNVYLVVTGKNKEKIYQLKTTGSDLSHIVRDSEHRSLRRDEIVEHNITKLLSSLNMDKKKTSKKKKGEEDRESDNSENCECDVKPRKSRVRITGKLGLTADDRYVLKCNATVDGKPIETNCYQETYDTYPMPSVPRHGLQSKFSPTKIKKTSDNNDSHYLINIMTNNNNNNSDNYEPNRSYHQREVNVQVNLEPEEIPFRCPRMQSLFNPLLMVPCPNRSVETQCNSSSFQTVCFSNFDKHKIVSNNRDQLVQCGCSELNVSSRSPEREQIFPMKNCQSPFVIISVYPKQDQPDDDSDNRRKPKSSPQRNGRRTSKSLKLESPTESPTQLVKSIPKSRSPSPTRGKKAKTEFKDQKSEAKTKTQKTKGNKETAGSRVQVVRKTSRKEKITETKVTKVGKKNVKGERGRTGKADTKDADVQANLPLEESPRAKNRGGAKSGQNRIATRANESLVKARVSANNDGSNVTINIDGERELYDVMFRRSRLGSDMYIRQTVKDQSSQKHDINEGSLENFLLVHDGQRKRSFSQTYILPVDSQTKVDSNLALNKNLPGISVRDSIEVSHRREEKVNSTIILHPQSSIDVHSTDFNKNFSAQAKVKHFTGDCCDLYNPVERDKEIRKLLKIQVNEMNISKNSKKTNVSKNAGHDNSLHCFFHTKEINRLPSKTIYKKATNICQAAAVASAKRDLSDLKKKSKLCGDCNKICNPPIICKCGQEKVKGKIPEVTCECEKYSKKCNAPIITCDCDKYPYRNTKCECDKFCADCGTTPASDDDSSRTDEEAIDDFEQAADDSTQDEESEESNETVGSDEYDEANIEGEEDDLCECCAGNYCSSPKEKQSPGSISETAGEINEWKPEIIDESTDTKNDSKSNKRITQEDNKTTRKYLMDDHIKPEVSFDEGIKSTKQDYNNTDRYSQKGDRINIDTIETIKRLIKEELNKTRQVQKNEHVSSATFVEKTIKPTKQESNNIIRRSLRDEPMTLDTFDGKSNKTTKKEIDKIDKSWPTDEKLSTKASIGNKPTQLIKNKTDQQNQQKCLTNNKCVCKKSGNLKSSPESSNPQYQQLILNRNINIYLQIEKFCKNKPIVLTRKQYEKVKRTIDNAGIKKNKHNRKKQVEKDDTDDSRKCKKCKAPCKKETITVPSCNRMTLIYSSGVENNLRKGQKAESQYLKELISGKKECITPEAIGKTDDAIFPPCQPNSGRNCAPECAVLTQISHGYKYKYQYGREKLNKPREEEDNNRETLRGRKKYRNKACSFGTYTQMVGTQCDEEGSGGRINNWGFKSWCRVKSSPKSTRNAASTTEVHYVTLTQTKRVTFSATNFAKYQQQPSIANVLKQNYETDSLHTLFKGHHRKLPTPNLGTSAYSLLSSSKTKLDSQELRPRRPFLRWLMSYLVMRSKIEKPPPDMKSVDSSIDSYHLSSSFGGIELTSSIYDTSASFFSGHSIRPINSKTKRGFFSSVRGFLGSRRN